MFASAPEGFSFAPGPENQLSVELPPISALVLRNPRPIEEITRHVSELRLEANRTGAIDDRWEVRVDLAPPQVASIAFGVRAKGESDYHYLGTADSPPYRVFPTRQAIPNAPALEFKAIARVLFGREATAEFEWQRRVPKRPAQSQ